MKNKKIIILVVILIAIIAVAVGVVYFLNGDSKKENANTLVNNEEIPEPQLENEVEEFVEVLDNGIKVNKSTKLAETKIVKGIEISNINFYMSNGQTYLTADVTNKSTKDIDVTEIEIILYDKENNKIATMGGVINPLKVGEKTKLQSSTTLDFANAYDFKVVII